MTTELQPIISLSVTRKVKVPTRGTSKSAGLDFYVPDDLTICELNRCYKNIGQNMFDHIIITKSIESPYSHDGIIDGSVDELEVVPGGELFIPTGIKVKLQKNTILKFENKSGIASKKGLLFGACVIDEDYQGIIHINLWNVSNKNVKVSMGDKIAQGVIYPVFLDMPKVVPIDELYTEVTDRGEGGFGSTGNK